MHKKLLTDSPFTRCRLAALAFCAVGALAGCAGKASNPPVESGTQSGNWTARHQAALSQARLVPDESAYETRYLQWHDVARQRGVQAKLYLPPSAVGNRPLPLVVFSHGIGGSREGYSYLGKNWAAQGYASLHVQHEGSDNRIWTSNTIELVGRLKAAATDTEALNRVHDLRFALDQVLADPLLSLKLDSQRVLAAGHSYGANTVLLASGAQVKRQGLPVLLRDARLKAAVIISAPPFHGESEQQTILQPIGIPTLHITSTGDDIRIPTYGSNYRDRIEVYEQTGGLNKTLVVYRDGSHSMFTDRLNTGGQELNPLIKKATLDLTLAFFSEVLQGKTTPLSAWSQRHASLVDRFESNRLHPTVR